MRLLLTACLPLFAALPSLAQGPSLKEARLRLLRGNYPEARKQFEQLLDDPKAGPAAALGLSLVWQARGEWEKAQEAVDAGLKKAPKDARLLARQAELHLLRGNWTAAGKAAEAALKEDAEAFLARWVQAELARACGDFKTAEDAYRWFVRTYAERLEKPNEIKDPEALTLVARAAAENARWNRLHDQWEVILDDLLAEALKLDPNWWPAEHLSGAILLEKFNRAGAFKAMQKVVTINPNSAEGLVGQGTAALQRFEIEDAEQFAERALKINPRLPEALRLRADVYLALSKPAEALQELELARKVNPRDERTLGRLAAILFIQKKKADFDRLLAEVLKDNPTPADFYLVLAERLEDRRYFAEAEKYFREAGKHKPTRTGSQTQLGLLFMRLGREKEAEEQLRLAFEGDPYNVRVANLRKVLRHLESYKTLKSPRGHFEIRHDPKTDAALAAYMSEYLEQIYEDLAKKFGHRPEGPILVEVFNRHDMFSGRTVALPDLHTIGACTGRMVAMVSPRGQGAFKKPFNWARVLRHEVVHIFNLDQTRYLLPHWFTEGLAVLNEGSTRPQVWNDLLKERVAAGKLYTLDDIDRGFIRPRGVVEWTLAYLQASLYVEYLQEKYKPESIAALLAAYAEGLETPAAIEKVCKTSRAEFEKGYREWLVRKARELPGKPVVKSRTVAQLKADYKKDPRDVDTAAELAVALFLDGDLEEARKLAEAVRETRAEHPLACYVLARLELRAGKRKEARALLEKGLNRQQPEPRIVRFLARIYYDASEFDQAAEILELASKAQPYEREWLLELARVYTRQEKRDRQIEVLRKLVQDDPDDLDRRRRLAKLLAEAGKWPEAEKFAREALEIDVKDREAQQTLFKALDAQKRNAEADRLRKILEQ